MKSLLRVVALIAVCVAAFAAAAIVYTPNAHAQEVPVAPTPPTPAPTPADNDSGNPADPAAPTPPADPAGASLTVEVPDVEGQPTQAVTLLIAVTVLAVAPSLLILLTGFTRIVIVMSLVRSALGLSGTPPNQVITGLALLLTLFVMGPVLAQMNDVGLQPYLAGELSVSEATEAASEPLKNWMLAQTRDAELKAMQDVSGDPAPATVEDVAFRVLVPAFVLSELKTAFILGFLIYVPFVVLDLITSSVLMSLGMMMLPPSFVSLPLKLLVFILADGWLLVTSTLLASFRGG